MVSPVSWPSTSRALRSWLIARCVIESQAGAERETIPQRDRIARKRGCGDELRADVRRHTGDRL